MPRPGRSHSLMAAFVHPGVEDAAPGPAQTSLAALVRAAGWWLPLLSSIALMQVLFCLL